MKRCPTCQRTYPEDSLTYCLDDGSPLLQVEAGSFDSPATAVIPEPRVTNPQQQVFNAPSSTGIKFDSRTIGIIGGSLLVVGVFMPLVSILGLIGISYFQLAQFSASFFTGIIIALIGVVSLIMAIKNQYQPLIPAGILALIILVIDFFRIRSAIGSGFPMQFPGAPRGVNPEMMGQALQSMIQISWGMFAMIAGAILLIVAGAKKPKVQASDPYWHNPPPPPTSYP